MEFLQNLFGNRLGKSKYGHSSSRGHHGGGRKGHNGGYNDAYYEQEQPVNTPPQRATYSKYCSSCGAGLQADSRFCAQCGTQITQ